ncbi:MAG: hypothetical protein ACJ790_06000 [Myxococcaceae bacterium]
MPVLREAPSITVKNLAAAAVVTALFVLGLAGCPTDDCANAPACQNGKALNCVDSCSVGPCSTGANFRDCGQLSCEVVIGNPASVRFSHDRALCVNDATACDPKTAPPPQCDFKGSVSGCSQYGRNITADCAQAAVFFDNATCCLTNVNPDAGAPDSGTPDAGSPDGGTDGGP